MSLENPLNPFDTVKQFEEEMAEFTSAPHAVAVDSCTSALFLCFSWLAKIRKNSLRVRKGMGESIAEFGDFVLRIPTRTFVGVPMMANHAGAKVQFDSDLWRDGMYPINMAEKKALLPNSGPTVWDAALCLKRDLFAHPEPDRTSIRLMCLSFQYRKHLPIGRGGMILHDGGDELNDYFKRMRFFGRAEVPAAEDPGPTLQGWRFYMTPEEAARGLCFMQNISDDLPPLRINYPDLSKYEVIDVV